VTGDDRPVPGDPVDGPADDLSEPTGPSELTWAWGLLRGMVGGVFEGLLRWKLRYRGIEHVPATGGAVIVWNHHSYSDFLFVALGIVRHRGRPVRILGKAEVWENPVTRWFADQAGAVPVYRLTEGGGRDALRAAVAALQAGDLVMLAPEQTISRSFELLPFASGAARMALAAGVPVIPVAGWGSHRAYTKGHAPVPVVGIPIEVWYGEPLHLAPAMDPDHATATIRAALEPMVHELQEAYPDTPAPDDDWWLPRRLGGSAPGHDDVVADHEAWRRSRGGGGR